MTKAKKEDLVSNRRAFHDYEILETLEAGIVLLGTEVKSLKDNGGNLQDAYILTSNSKVILKNASISVYSFGNVHNREIAQLKNASDRKGLTLIPLAMYLKGGIIKVKVGIAKGKKSHDKRDSLKEKEHKRDMDRALKNSRE